MTALLRSTPHNTRPISGEAPFALEELFFSRTDERGVIQAFNDIFLRVADYPAADMLGAPHRLIRHEDMPKGVFHLFWEFLQAGRPVGAYVKNRARDGLYYWVFAVVLPVETGGYLSVRLKPSAALLAKVSALYARLLAEEKQDGLTPAASAIRLREMLAEAGYAHYADFQARALAEELKARSATLGRRADREQRGLLELVDATSQVRNERSGVLEVLDQLRLLPTNMRLISQRLERGSGPLSTISERYGAMVEGLLRQLQQVVNADQQWGRSEAFSLFLSGAARLTQEAGEHFAASSAQTAGVDRAAEMRVLQQVSQTAQSGARSAAQKSGVGAIKLARELDLLRRATLALDSIRVMCRVEFGQLREKNPELANVILRIDRSHHAMASHLTRIAEAAQAIEDVTAQLFRNREV
jgi:hypothetical protein